MKDLRPFLVLVLALLSVALPVGASEMEPDVASDLETVTMETEVDGGDIIVNVTVPIVPPSPTPSPMPEPEPKAEEDTEDAPSAITSYAILSPDDIPSGDDDAALKAIVSTLFGEYSPRTQTMTQYLPDGSAVTSQEYVPGMAGMDWHWLVGVFLFSIVLYCFFRLVGVLLK